MIAARAVAALVALLMSGCLAQLPDENVPAGAETADLSGVGAAASVDGGPVVPPDGAGPGSQRPVDGAIATTVDGGANAAPGCQNAALLFCEDFEASAPGDAKSSRWTPTANNGKLTIDATHAIGARALHVHTDGNGFAYLKPNAFAPPGNSFYGRMRAWVTAFPSAPDYAHFTMVEAAGMGAGLVRAIGGQYIPAPTAGRSLWGVGSDGGPTGDWTNWKVSAPAESGRWLCLEWQLDASNNQVNVWLDGVAKPELTVSTQQHGGNPVDFVFPKLNSIWFGWWLYQGGPTPSSFDLWLDDLALSSTRIGC